MTKFIVRALGLLLCFISLSASAYNITYSSPGVVRAIGGLDVGGTFYNVDFDQGAGYVTYSGDNKFWDGDTAGAGAARDSITVVLNAIGATGLDNGSGVQHNTRIEGPVEFPTSLWAFGTLNAGTWENNATATSGGPAESYTAWSVTAVPIPAAAWLFGSAIGLLGWMRRKQSV